MKKIITFIVIAIISVINFNVTAQSATLTMGSESNCEQYPEKEKKEVPPGTLVYKSNGKKIDFEKSALSLKHCYILDKNGNLSRTFIFDIKGKSKERIYVEVNNWFIHTFNNGKSVIQLNDKEEGCIIGKGHIPFLGAHFSAFYNIKLSTWIIIRVDIKDEKIRVSTTISGYEIERGTGGFGAFAAGMNGVRPQTIYYEKEAKDCFPFTKKQKKEGSIGFVNGHIESENLIKSIYAAAKGGMIGNENHDW
jgi:hypothetical protein